MHKSKRDTCITHTHTHTHTRHLIGVPSKRVLLRTLKHKTKNAEGKDLDERGVGAGAIEHARLERVGGHRHRLRRDGCVCKFNSEFCFV